MVLQVAVENVRHRRVQRDLATERLDRGLVRARVVRIIRTPTDGDVRTPPTDVHVADVQLQAFAAPEPEREQHRDEQPVAETHRALKRIARMLGMDDIEKQGALIGVQAYALRVAIGSRPLKLCGLPAQQVASLADADGTRVAHVEIIERAFEAPGEVRPSDAHADRIRLAVHDRQLSRVHQLSSDGGTSRGSHVAQVLIECVELRGPQALPETKRASRSMPRRIAHSWM